MADGMMHEGDMDELYRIMGEQPIDARMRTVQVVNAVDGAVRCKTRDGVEVLIALSDIPKNLPSSRGSMLFAAQVTSGDPLQATLRGLQIVHAAAAGVVPEVRQGTVRIMKVARIPGQRTKIAVASTQEGVEPVRAMLGRAACRVRAISRLLMGERIDIVHYSPDPAQMLRSALAPAEVCDVLVEGRYAVASVPAHLSQAAVGGSGWNAQLAGRLAGLTVSIVKDGQDLREELERITSSGLREQDQPPSSPAPQKEEDAAPANDASAS